ncbi:nucleotidyltransferase domain-containing protein [Trinickia fusca]|uniref:Uncharacterized protein n=1 Tax=Trinickia fusca TaxID=2419777 RepID=A0A494WXZ8_9BURK|nr:nucleotidyltransferase domain-containing protein [Trinickia fusca]RKP43415.1 hypothetical protein D7S89_26065 [Trinickia fusca]
MMTRDASIDVTKLDGDWILDALPESIHKHVLFACLIGSHAEGLATVTSDIDVMLVHKDDASRTLFFGANGPTLCGGLRIDIIAFSHNEVMRLLESGRGDLNKLSTRQVELIHKILKGRPIFNHRNHQNLIANIRIEDFNRGMYFRYLWMANDQYTDLVGLIEGGHIREAAETARSLTRSYTDAFLAMRGDTYPRSKWRLSKLERSLSQKSLLFREILGIEFGGAREINDESLYRLIYRCMAVVRMLQISCYFNSELVEYLYAPPCTADYISRINQIERSGEKFILRHALEEKVVDPLTAICLLVDEQRSDADIYSALKFVNFDGGFSLQSIARRRQILKNLGFLS